MTHHHNQSTVVTDDTARDVATSQQPTAASKLTLPAPDKLLQLSTPSRPQLRHPHQQSRSLVTAAAVPIQPLHSLDSGALAGVRVAKLTVPHGPYSLLPAPATVDDSVGGWHPWPGVDLSYQKRRNDVEHILEMMSRPRRFHDRASTSDAGMESPLTMTAGSTAASSTVASSAASSRRPSANGSVSIGDDRSEHQAERIFKAYKLTGRLHNFACGQAAKAMSDRDLAVHVRQSVSDIAQIFNDYCHTGDRIAPIQTVAQSPDSGRAAKRRSKSESLNGAMRCHACNCTDTPEWRRGPDGARTLCNACGLHYAKLKRQKRIQAASAPEQSSTTTSTTTQPPYHLSTAAKGERTYPLVAPKTVAPMPTGMQILSAAAESRQLQPASSLTAAASKSKKRTVIDYSGRFHTDRAPSAVSTAQHNAAAMQLFELAVLATPEVTIPNPQAESATVVVDSIPAAPTSKPMAVMSLLN